MQIGKKDQLVRRGKRIQIDKKDSQLEKEKEFRKERLVSQKKKMNLDRKKSQLGRR